MSDACTIGPFPLPLKARGNKHLGGRTKAHWSGEAGLAKEQRRIVAQQFAGLCGTCGARLRPVQMGADRWQNAFPCGHLRARVVPIRLPPHGPEHPVDVLLVRVPSHGGSYLDSHDGLPHAFKAVADEITEQLWPKDPDRKPIGKVDDSAPWLRWCYGQRPHRKAKNPRRLTERKDWVPGPPDPPNKGTELCQIIISPREDCGARLRERIVDVAQGLGLGLEDCGCSRSMLPLRWRRDEL